MLAICYLVSSNTSVDETSEHHLRKSSTLAVFSFVSLQYEINKDLSGP